jgi:hypothetical protein
MTATPNTKQTVLDSLRESHREWPYSEAHDTVNGDPWPLAWDAAAFIEEWFAHPEHNDVEEAICYVELTPSKFGYDVADWHFKQPPASLLKAHLLRIVKGWGGETALHDYLDDNPELVAELGFGDGLASKTTLWRVWNENRLSDGYKRVVRTIGQVLVDVELVMMDREFAHDPVKEVCEDHGVWYLNPGVMRTSERATCTRLRRQEKFVHIEGDEASTDDADVGTTLGEESDEEDVLRQELLRDFAEATDADTEDVGQMFGDVIEEDEQESPGSEENKELYMLFETNHPDLELPDETGEDGDEMSEMEKAHMTGRVIRKYNIGGGLRTGSSRSRASVSVPRRWITSTGSSTSCTRVRCTMCGDSPIYW